MSSVELAPGANAPLDGLRRSAQRVVLALVGDRRDRRDDLADADAVVDAEVREPDVVAGCSYDRRPADVTRLAREPLRDSELVLGAVLVRDVRPAHVEAARRAPGGDTAGAVRTHVPVQRRPIARDPRQRDRNDSRRSGERLARPDEAVVGAEVLAVDSSTRSASPRGPAPTRRTASARRTGTRSRLSSRASWSLRLKFCNPVGAATDGPPLAAPAATGIAATTASTAA